MKLYFITAPLIATLLIARWNKGTPLTSIKGLGVCQPAFVNLEPSPAIGMMMCNGLMLELPAINDETILWDGVR
jgi:hypothetical protein